MSISILSTKASTVLGKCSILILAALLLKMINYPFLWETIAILAATTLFPAQRRTILLVGTVFFWLSGYHFPEQMLQRLMYYKQLILPIEVTAVDRFLVISVILALCILILTFFTRTKLGKQIKLPIVWVLFCYLAVLAWLSYQTTQHISYSYFWMTTIYFNGFLWYLAYSLQLKDQQHPTIYQQFFQYMPFWNSYLSSPTPKGESYLAKIEAKNSQELAISQIKGLKLLYWAFILYIVYLVLQCIFYGVSPETIGALQLRKNYNEIQLWQGSQLIVDIIKLPWSGEVTPFLKAIEQCTASVCPSASTNWPSLIAWFSSDLLYKAVFFHVIISIVRLAGFNALRGMNKPLASKSIADFWNRFDYYFKELLVNVFYMPFFLKYFRKKTLLRMYAAVIFAVFFGNFTLHFLWQQRFILELGFFTALYEFRVEAFSAFILAHAIFISQWLQQGHQPNQHWFNIKIFLPFKVLSFFAFWWIFNEAPLGSDLMPRIRFFYSLFGM